MAFLFTPRSVQLVARMIKTLTSMRNSRFRALNTKVMEDYIRNQEKEDMVQDNLSTKEHIDPFKG